MCRLGQSEGGNQRAAQGARKGLAGESRKRRIVGPETSEGGDIGGGQTEGPSIEGGAEGEAPRCGRAATRATSWAVQVGKEPRAMGDHRTPLYWATLARNKQKAELISAGPGVRGA